MKTTLFFLLAAALASFGADRVNLDKVDAAGSGMDVHRLSMISARMEEFVAAGQTAGTVTVVGRHGKVASFEAIGYSDLESKTPMRKDSMFRIASLTKPVTCAGIMALVDDGRLSVIDPVEKYLPEFKGMEVRSCDGRIGYGCEGVLPSRPIDIEDLMTHTSGLETSSPGQGEPKSLAELAGRAAKSMLLFEPGTRWNYSNAGYDILGRIIEVVSNQPYDAFLKQRIFDPLHMDDTYFFVPENKLSRLTTLYSQENGKLVRAKDQSSAQQEVKVPHPAGGIVSTAADMFRFNLMMRNKGTLDGHRILSEAAVTLMTTNHTADLKAGWTPGVGHGYGYEVVRNADGMFRYNSIGSFVKGGAFRTYEWVDPEKDLVGVFMMQRTNGGDTAEEINAFMAISAAAIE